MRVRHAAALALAAALAAVLGACAAKPIVLTPPAPNVGADGRYRGTARLVNAERGYNCPRSGPRVLQISGGTIELSYSGDTQRSRVKLSAPIGADGRIQASDGVGTMEGMLQDGQLGVTIASRSCEHRWTLSKVG